MADRGGRQGGFENRMKLPEVQTEADRARRDDNSVLVNFSPQLTEHDIFMFFSKKAGKLNDIEIIKTTSGKSKGFAYIEFASQEAARKSLMLTGKELKGFPIRVEQSNAEKNRRAPSTRGIAMANQTLARKSGFRIYVGNLVGILKNITVADLEKLYTPFGLIVDVDLVLDPYEQTPVGYAIIVFKGRSNAANAAFATEGFELAGVPLRVCYLGDMVSNVIERINVPLQCPSTMVQLPVGPAIN